MDAVVSSNSKSFSTNSFFTPLFISILGIGATALAILMYHLLVVRYCMRRQAARMASIQTMAGGAEIPTGVDEKTLLTIPIITYTTPDSSMDPYECAVCLGDVDNGDKVRLLPNCKHMFHVKCIDEWFVGHTSCPVCRVPVVAPDDEARSCPVCRSVGALTDDHNTTSVGSTPEGHDHQTDSGIDVLDGINDGELTSGPRVRSGEMLRHCNSLVLPRETKEMLSGMELKRSLSMGQTACVTIDIQLDNVDKDCQYYSSIRDQSIRGFLRVSSKVRQSISRMCVGQESGILPY
ncbi:unnamed protein product [Lactuca virosa]|uniref:RING-type E3 ubiquitin transferase n=1 Tax=Lactuca virosa TaxID=75947 RepID=A0AAU9NW68_9ASTR|nr:unnamed protein product [Lactuca virosa]